MRNKTRLKAPLRTMTAAVGSLALLVLLQATSAQNNVDPVPFTVIATGSGLNVTVEGTATRIDDETVAVQGILTAVSDPQIPCEADAKAKVDGGTELLAKSGCNTGLVRFGRKIRSEVVGSLPRHMQISVRALLLAASVSSSVDIRV